jgi:hypothetical protein
MRHRDSNNQEAALALHTCSLGFFGLRNVDDGDITHACQRFGLLLHKDAKMRVVWFRIPTRYQENAKSASHPSGCL